MQVAARRLDPPHASQAARVSLRADVALADGFRLPMRDAACDAVLCIAVLHHISNVPRRCAPAPHVPRNTRPSSQCMACAMLPAMLSSALLCCTTSAMSLTGVHQPLVYFRIPVPPVSLWLVMGDRWISSIPCRYALAPRVLRNTCLSMCYSWCWALQWVIATSAAKNLGRGTSALCALQHPQLPMFCLECRGLCWVVAASAASRAGAVQPIAHSHLPIPPLGTVSP